MSSVKAELLSAIELKLKINLREFQGLHGQLSGRIRHSYDNNQHLLPILHNVINNNFKALEFILRFLDDKDIICVASTCQTLYRLLYSPLGYRLVRHLRPVVCVVTRADEFPQFSQTTLENLCSDRSLVDLDEDDKVALILTMKTNLMATKQKIRELQNCNNQYDRRKRQMLEETFYVSGQREQLIRDSEHLKEKIDKLTEMLSLSENHAKELCLEQEKLLVQRQAKRKAMEAEKDKLQGQKELLIKKIKSQQKQRQQGLAYAREVTRVVSLLSSITKPNR